MAKSKFVMTKNELIEALVTEELTNDYLEKQLTIKDKEFKAELKSQKSTSDLEIKTLKSRCNVLELRVNQVFHALLAYDAIDPIKVNDGIQERTDVQSQRRHLIDIVRGCSAL